MVVSVRRTVMAARAAQATANNTISLTNSLKRWKFFGNLVVISWPKAVQIFPPRASAF